MALIELVDWAGMQEGAIRQETSQTHAQAQSS
jgi:hypothetical protein